MPSATLQVQTLRPSFSGLVDDEALGQYLAGAVRDAVDRGAGGPAVAAIWRDELHVIPIQPLLKASWSVSWFLASLSRTAHPERGLPDAVAAVGRVRVRRRTEEPWTPLAVVFIEWPDGRWWRWRQLLDAQGRRIDGSEIVDRAVDGLPKPDHLGGWWRLGRLGAPPLTITARSEPPVAVVH